MQKVKMQVAGVQRTVYLERFNTTNRCYDSYNARVYVDGNRVVSGEYRLYDSGVRRFIPTTKLSKRLLEQSK